MGIDGAPLQLFLDDLVGEERRAASCALGLIAGGAQPAWSGTAAARAEPPRLDTLFDIASLTKPIMATLALVLHRQALLPLTTRLGDIWPRGGDRVRRLRLEQLLRHRSRLAAWRPLYAMASAPGDEVVAMLLDDDLLSAPLGTYSDLGYILWGLSVERALQTDLYSVLHEFLLAPLTLEGVTASPAARHSVAPCECDNEVEVRMAAKLGIAVAPKAPPRRATPHDGNAAFLGLAGHAGLFADASSLLAFAQSWLAALEGRPSFLAGETCRRALVGRGEYALGWARRRARGSAGPALSKTSFGHAGFTGTSLWIDPQYHRIMILLAQRRSGLAEFNSHRRRFHAVAAAALGN